MTPFDLTPTAARRALAGITDVDHLEDEAAIDRYARAIWSGVGEPGDGVAGELVAALGAPEALARAADRALRLDGVSAHDLERARDRWKPRLRAQPIVDALSIAAARGIRLLTPDDPHWPGQVHDLGRHAPLCLWVRGDTAALASLQPSVAIVGARASTGYGDHVAMELAAELTGGGIPVVSGGAYGIDGAAHRAALRVGGRTVALLAGGVEKAYPTGHTRLIDDIADAAAVVSEVPCGSTPTKWRFLQRNRLIAALSDATIVVEAGWRSGSLNTANHALQLGRALGAVPGPVTSPASAGALQLLRSGQAQCITSADDVRELIGLGATASQHPSDGRPATDSATRVRDALSTRSWRDASDVAQRSGMARIEVEGLLGMLQLGGEVERGAGGWRRVAGAAVRGA
ncbi:DNA-processing protein DprA [Microbacterium aoyamense]|uniref:DNA-processing protein DprA n=1 Tax=Microbacterium aoyamense TaxID=344166 RepID=A0ABN2P7V2_9MICO|nr:DNA-processing protein DprA [Microbacterium aoyamense]